MMRDGGEKDVILKLNRINAQLIVETSQLKEKRWDKRYLTKCIRTNTSGMF